MSIKRKAATALVVALAGVGTLGAPAATASTAEPDSIVVDGQELSSKDGLSVITESYPVVAGQQTGAAYGSDTSRDEWGSSYAFSQELAYVSYIGHAKSGGERT